MTAPDFAGVLAAHVDVGGMLSDEHGYQKYVCLCGEGDNDYRWHRAHVAAQLRAEVVAWLESEAAVEVIIVALDDQETFRTNARAALDALAEQVGPS